MQISSENDDEILDDFDAENIDLYKYVHPSIRKVLVMESDNTIFDDFCGFKNNNNNIIDDCSDSTKTVLVNSDNYIINWNLLEEFIEWEKTKTKSGVPSGAPSPDQQDNNNISVETLVTLASQSELAIFQDNNIHISTIIDNDNIEVLPSPIRGLLKMIPHNDDDDLGAHTLIATLIAVNMVENSIRHLIGKQHGRAPLLKDMIEIIASKESEKDHDDNHRHNHPPKILAAVLQTLLLPKNNGINLRNLLWHGFLPVINRKWFALSISLVLSLDELASSSSFDVPCNDNDDNNNNLDENLESLVVMRQHEALVTILDHGKHIRSSREMLTTLEEQITRRSDNSIPRSHQELIKVVLENYMNYPIIFASVTSPLIEHILRIMWCNENQQKKYIAEPESYYVTLDGHGQKDKHEIMIMPYFSSQPQQQQEITEGTGATKGIIRNRLVYRLGAPTTAFLIDMFLSPSGGPNIRASVAHGIFNRYLFEELGNIEVQDSVPHNNSNTFELEDMVNALISVLHILCDDSQYDDITCESNPNYKMNVALSSYRPCFSFSALLLSEVDNMVDQIKPFYQLIRDGRYLKYSTNGSQKSQLQRDVAKAMATMSQSIESIMDIRVRIYEGFGIDKSKYYTSESYFRESSNNLSASECGAAKLLLSEISAATSSLLQDLNDGIAAFQCDKTQLSSRRRKQLSQKCDAAKLTLDFYSFAAFCALLYIERRQYDTNTASGNMPVIRYPATRYSNLTDDVLFVAVKRSRMVVSTFSTTKTFDRALSALAQYTAGKAVKAIIKEVIRNTSVE